jgi:phosphate-selective porin
MPNPTIEPAPANQPNSAPAQAQQAAPPAGQAAPSLSGELKKVEAADKKKEKPPIPDFAKAILIAQNEGDLTFKPGLRIQPRYMFDSGNDNNDFFIRRFRLKGSGSAYGVAKYGVELKIDNEGRFGVSPAARAENAWLDFPVIDDYAYLRCGLYDLPFSRDALTSDSKLLFMDRTLIKEQLTAVGMADNTFGVMLHGRPDCGHFEYAFGIFDNDRFERFGPTGTLESDELMPAGRIVWSLWDPMTPLDGYADYMESYIGKGERLEIGTNVAFLGDAIDAAIEQDITAWGVDLFANSGHFTFQTEYDRIIEDIAGAANIIADGWYIQFGYLFDICNPCTEFCVRYEELDPLVGEDLNWWRVGFNFYIREHNLKIQTDYNIRSHNTLTAPLPGGLGFFDDNVFEVQLQLDF